MTEISPALLEALAIDDQTERQLEVAAVVSEALEEIGVHPVVVGGLAVAYWTAGAYLTGDIDVVMPWSPEVDERMASLGFEKEGRHWVVRELALEAPGGSLGVGEETAAITTGRGRSLKLLCVEEALIYRLHEFAVTGHSLPFGQILMLLDSGSLDRKRLESLAGREHLASALQEVEALAVRVRQGGVLETWDLHDAVRRLQ